MLVLKCGRLVTVSGETFENTNLLIDGGKIVSVGGEIPEGAEIIDVSDKWVYPGIIDASSHIGVNKEPYGFSTDIREGSDKGDPMQPQLISADSFNPYDRTVERVRRGGITTVFVAAGPGSVIDGMGQTMKLRRAETAAEMIVPGTRQMCFTLGGEVLENYARAKKAPFTRMAVLDMLRDILTRAKARMNDPSAVPDRKLDALIPALKGEMVCRFECLRSDDIASAVALAEEFGLKYVIVGGHEALKVKNFAAAHNVPFILEALPFGAFRGMDYFGTYDVDFTTAGVLSEKGCPVAVTANAVTHTEKIPYMAGFLTAYGMDPQAAIESVTITPARLLGIADRVGSIEPGKDADIAVFTGDALLNYSRCVMTIVDGEVVYRE